MDVEETTAFLTWLDQNGFKILDTAQGGVILTLPQVEQLVADFGDDA